MRSVIILCSILAAIAVAAIGTSYYVSRTLDESENEIVLSQAEDLETVARLLESDEKADAEKALELIMKHHDAMIAPGEIGRQWTDHFITASVKLQAWGPLVSLFEFSPAAFDDREEAAVPLAGLFLQIQRPEDYQTLRDRWIDRTTREEDWFLLDGGKLSVQGEIEEAIEFLKSRELTGDYETRRLVQLGMLHVKSDPGEAWNYLTRAAKHDDDNADIRLLRARLLEAHGKIPLAESEYFAAVAEDPESWRLFDELGEFYRRHKRYRDALLAWGQGLKTPNDVMWTKVKFWSMLLQPVIAEWPNTEDMEEGPLKPLYVYMQTLPEGVYWDEKAAAANPKLGHFLSSHPAPFWLWRGQHLKDGNEEKALELVELTPSGAASWDPDLKLALHRILHFRQHDTLELDALSVKAPRKHGFFQLLDQVTSDETKPATRENLPDHLLTLLDSDEVFAAAFLAAGWNEAAIQVSQVGVLSEEMPEWVAYMMTQALRVNRGALESLAYASRQKQTDPMKLLTAEVLISNGDVEAAKEYLEPFAKEDSVVGFRASWLLTMIAMERKEFDAAVSIVEGNTKLSTSLLGKEIRARIAMLKGDKDLASQLYSQIQKESTEAKSYLAQQAFADGDLERARAITEEMLKQHPNNATIRKNYKEILERLENEN